MGKKIEVKYTFLLVCLLLLGAAILVYMGVRAYRADVYLDSDQGRYETAKTTSPTPTQLVNPIKSIH